MSAPGAGDFDALYAATARRVVLHVYAVCGDLGDAQDVVQEAYARAWQHWPKVSGLVVVTGLAGAGVARMAAAPAPPPPAPPAEAPEPCGNRVDLRLPDDVAAVPVRVLDGTGAGRDRSVAGDLRARGFTGAVAAGGAPPTDTVAIVRYGPESVGRAALLQVMLRRQATTQFDPARSDGIVEIVVGSRYRRLATPTETNVALAESGPPTMPPEGGTPTPSPTR